MMFIMFRVCGQTVIQSNISGTVTDDKGNPRPGAIVMLMNAGIVDTADTNGHFSLQGDVGVHQLQSPSVADNGVGIRNGRLYFTIHNVKTPVKVELFNCRGRMLFSMPPVDFLPGSHYVAIGTLSSQNIALIAIARVTIGSNETILRFADLGGPSVQSKPSSRSPRFLAKTQAVVDTLLVSDYDFLNSRTLITEYAGSPQQIALTKDNRTDKLVLNDVYAFGPGRIGESTDEIYRAPGGDSGTTISFYAKRQLEPPDNLDIDYVSFSNPEPNGVWPHRIVYSRELLPINWAIDSFTIVVFSHGLDTINPHQVLHALYGADTSGSSDTFTLDLHPGDLHAFLGRCKVAVPDFDTMPVHNFLAANGINNYNDLLHKAYFDSVQMAYYRYLCVVVSTAHACIELQKAFPVSLAKRAGKPDFDPCANDRFCPTTIAKILLKAMLKNVLREIARDLLAKKPSSGFDALLCEGGDQNWDECKYEYVRYKKDFYGTVPQEATDKCMKICSWVTLACFTNICEPMTLEEAEAMDIKKQLAAFDQQYFGGALSSGGVLAKRGRK
jgi:hypothetical protein